MLAVVNIMCLNHSLEVATPFSGSPSYSLVHNNIMKNEVKQPVTKNPDPNCDKIRIVVANGSIVNKDNRRDAENYSEPIIFFECMIMLRVMGLVPRPHESVHDVLVREPGDKFPKQESGHNYNGTYYECQPAH